MEHSPGQITSWVTNQALVNLSKLKSYQASFPNHNTMRLEINYSEKNRKKHKHMEGKQYVVNNQEITEEVRGNQKIPRDKWQ